jgi:selenocysteine-specific translation elongation factor
MIVATAGHIDHGKTSLVRALTGVDADRLPEEKRRGLTIDLGFAYLPLPDGTILGFVDVPGHEKFVRNMLAGVGGIDFGLLVVAADDGVMPQTREHLAILDLLQVPRGAVAITKVDRVPEERRRAVENEVAALLKPTVLAEAPLFPLSSTTGAGVPELAAHLTRTARASRRRRRLPARRRPLLHAARHRYRRDGYRLRRVGQGGRPPPPFACRARGARARHPCPEPRDACGTRGRALRPQHRRHRTVEGRRAPR